MFTPKERGHEASEARPEHASGSQPRRAGARASRAVVAAAVLGLAVIAGAAALIFGADCFKTIYEGGGSVGSVSENRTQG